MKIRSLSVVERGMIVTIALLLALVALRWGYIRRRAADGMRYLKPVDSALVQPPAAESCD
ncbi:MAG: hypothetical protein LBB79_05690 [Prevotellaceae bacterium]|jgi:hypothetical protein|nr:hypothetical protein [Prevotellaceae bacterium]